jgi:hypothetical protein
VEPLRVKVYGLFSITRRRYVAQLVVASVLIAVLLAVWVVRRLTLHEQALKVPALAPLVNLFDLLPWIALGLGALQAIEAWFVLRAFARKQAARAAADQPVSPPSA